MKLSFHAIDIIGCRSHFSLISIICLTSYVLKWPRVKKAGAVNFQEGKISGGILSISGNPRIASNNRQADESIYKTQSCIRSRLELESRIADRTICPLLTEVGQKLFLRCRRPRRLSNFRKPQRFQQYKCQLLMIIRQLQISGTNRKNISQLHLSLF